MYIDYPMDYDGSEMRRYSHLLTDESVENLHMFADRCGLSIVDYHEKPYPYYVVSRDLHVHVISLGAKLVPVIKLVSVCVLPYSRCKDKVKKEKYYGFLSSTFKEAI